MRNISWISLQPLTGGMYIGFENIFGCSAKYIISYKGLNDYKEIKNKRGTCGNEYNLTNYLREVGRDVPRYEFQHNMFDMVDVNNVILNPDRFNNNDKEISFDNIDVVCAVPVCSGLSLLAATDNVTKEKKNCNMKFLAEYAIKVIQPKIYVFENAPGFMSDKGDELRMYFEKLAEENRYSITYLKTDTKYHYNCQRRPRTFVIFVKWSENGKYERSPETPIYEDKQMTLEEVFSRIPDDALYMDSLPAPLYENETCINYAKERFGQSWRDWFSGDIIQKLISNNLLDDFENWCRQTTSVNKSFAERMVKHINHIKECKANAKGWWASYPHYYKTLSPAVQSRTIYAMIHPTEDRLCSERELLTLMGMPYDFCMCGDFMLDGRKIGQNVPVKTSEWVARICVDLLNTIDSYGIKRETYIPGVTPHNGARFYDNTKQKEVY